MKRRFLSAIAALCLAAVGLVTPLNLASATPDWPVKIEGMSIRAAVPQQNGNLWMSACSQANIDGNIATYVSTEGRVNFSIPKNSQSPIACYDEAEPGIASGLFIGSHETNTTSGASSKMVGWKNGRELWDINSTALTSCATFGSYEDRRMRPTSITEGADGNLYMILVASGISPATCADRLFGLNPSTGETIMDIPLSSGMGPYYESPSLPTQVWAYENEIVTLSKSRLMQVFNYGGVENITKQYQFTVPGVRYAQLTEDGTLYVIDIDDRVAYHNIDGNSAILPWHNGSRVRFGGSSLGANNTVLGFNADSRSIVRYGSNTVSSQQTFTPIQAGFSNNWLVDYVEDNEGNALLMWSHADSSYTQNAVSIDLFDKTTLSTTQLFSTENNAGKPLNENYSINTSPQGMLSRMIAEGYLYLPVCYGAGCYSSSSSPVTWVHKISTGVFDVPVSNAHSRNSYESQKLEYVALGDSFSSGEGVEPFLNGTANDGTNECHRSEDAYPLLLEEDEILNLNLTAFVACSGATTNTVLNGGTGAGSWNEAPQLNALSTSTSVASISIGGNDIGFGQVLSDCSLLNTQPSTWTLGQDAYDEYMCLNSMEDAEQRIYGTTPIDGSQTFDDVMSNALNQLASKVGENTRILVIGYPYLLPEYQDIQGSCTWGAYFGAGLTSDRIVSEDEVNMLRHVTEVLNTSISVAVSNLKDSRLTYVDSTEAFMGHELCRSDPYFFHINYSVQPSGHYHPNVAGHEAYYQLLKEKLS